MKRSNGIELLKFSIKKVLTKYGKWFLEMRGNPVISSIPFKPSTRNLHFSCPLTAKTSRLTRFVKSFQKGWTGFCGTYIARSLAKFNIYETPVQCTNVLELNLS